MADRIELQLTGVDDLRLAMRVLPAKLRGKLLVKALRAAAKIPLQEARAKVPVMSSIDDVRMPHRKSGTIKRALGIRVSKWAKREGNVGVYVGVRPLSKSKIRAFKKSAGQRGMKVSGAMNPDDPYYWSWVEFGHRIVPRARKSGVIESRRIMVTRNGKTFGRTVRRDAEGLRAQRASAARTVAPIPFMRPAGEKLPEALAVFEREAVAAIEALDKEVR